MKLRRITLVAALAVGTFAAQSVTAPTGAHAQCGWYAIGACARGYPNNPMGWAIINTSNVQGFRNGYYCVVSGPQSKRGAQRDRNTLRRNWGIGSAYIKRGCE